ncbi:bifunctional methionine sulfoxide reductase B/A protein [candidate division WOR-3 bacterium]|nr:bifunctional methionine sulfoxide reductase B/A protein [candidate division WOR-3 bacterium]
MNQKFYNELTPEEQRVIIEKGTEAPFSGEYNDFFESGYYRCRRCDAPLYRSEDKFRSGCGWPSFDDEIEGAVLRRTDADGMRTEIICANCGAHLGHVFLGENLTDKNTRHCVNSISLVFVPDDSLLKKAYFAGGCFWGVEYQFEKKDGVISVVSGYMGGSRENPSYQDVCAGNTGHLESVEVTYDPSKISFEELSKLFFEIHDPTQVNRQGPDVGEQYSSAVFYGNDEEKNVAQSLIDILEEKGYNIATRLLPVQEFWKAEDYHQDYYRNNGGQPHCHSYVKRFD